VGDIDPQKYFPAKTIKGKKEQKKGTEKKN